MTHVERIAEFATRASFDAISTPARDQIKIAKGVVASWWQLRKALADAARGDELSIYVDGKIYRVVVVEKKRQAEEPKGDIA